MKFKPHLLAVLCVCALISTTGCYRDELANFQKQIDDFKQTSVDGLDKRVKTVEEQITQINQSITDLQNISKELSGKIDEVNSTIATLSQQMKEGDEALKGDISILKESVKQLEAQKTEVDQKIAELKAFVQDELKKTTDWVSATFATIDKMNEVSQTVATIQTAMESIKEASARHDQEIAALKTDLSKVEDNLKSWVNGQLTAYYTMAQIDAKLTELSQSFTAADDALRTELKNEINSSYNKITEEYKAAIEEAITKSSGEISEEVQKKIDALKNELEPRIKSMEDRLEGLEASIAKLDGRVKSLEEQVKDMQSSINNLEYASTQADKAIKELQGIVDELKNTTIPGLEAKVNTYEGRIKALEDYKAELQETIKKIQDDIKALETKLDQKFTEYDKAIKEWVEESLKNYCTKDDVEKLLSNLKTEIQKAIDDAVEIEKKAREAADSALEKKLQDQIDALKEDVAELKKVEESIHKWVMEYVSGYTYDKATIDQKLKALEDAYKKADEGLKENIAAAKKELEEKITAKASEIETAYKKAIEDAITDARGKITEEIQTAIKGVTKDLSELTEKVSGLAKQVEQNTKDIKALQEADKLINKSIDEILATIGDRPKEEQRTIWECISALITEDTTIKGLITTLRGGYEGSLTDLIDDLQKYADGLITTLRGGYTGSLKDLSDAISSITDKTGDIWTAIKKNSDDIITINAYLGDEKSPAEGTVRYQLADLYSQLGKSTDDDTKTTIYGKIAKCNSEIATIWAIIGKDGKTIDEKIAVAKKEISDRLDKIPYGTNEQKEQLYDTIENVIKSIESRLKELEKRISVVEDAISNLKSSSTNLRSAIDSLGAIIGKQSDKKSETVQTLWAYINALLAADTSIEGMITTLRGTYTGNISDLIIELKKYTDDLGTAIRGAECPDDVTLKSLNDAINNITSSEGDIWTAINDNTADITTIKNYLYGEGGSKDNPKAGSIFAELNSLKNQLGTDDGKGAIFLRVATLEAHISSLIAALGGQGETLEEQIEYIKNTIMKRLDTISTYKDEKGVAINQLENIFANISSRLAAIEGDIVLLKQADVNLRHAIDSLGLIIGTKNQKDTVTTKTLWAYVNALVAADVSINNLISELRGSYDKSMSQLLADAKKYSDDVIKALKNELKGGETTETLYSLAQAIMGINSKTGEIWTAISTNSTDIATIKEYLYGKDGSKDNPEKGSIYYELNYLKKQLTDDKTSGTIVYRIAALETQVAAWLAVLGEDGSTITKKIEKVQSDIKDRLEKIKGYSDKSGTAITVLEDIFADISTRLKDIEDQLNGLKGIKSMSAVPDFSDGSVAVPFSYGTVKGEFTQKNFTVKYKILPDGMAAKIKKAYDEDNNIVKVVYKEVMTKGAGMLAASEQAINTCSVNTDDSNILDVTFNYTDITNTNFYKTQFLFDKHQAISLALNIYAKKETVYSLAYSSNYVELYPYCKITLDFSPESSDLGQFEWKGGSKDSKFKTLMVTSKSGSDPQEGYVGWKIASLPSWVHVYPEKSLYDSGESIKLYVESTTKTSARSADIIFQSASEEKFDYPISQAGRTAQTLNASPSSGTFNFNAKGVIQGSGAKNTITVSSSDNETDWDYTVTDASGNPVNWVTIDRKEKVPNTTLTITVSTNNSKSNRSATLKLIPATGGDGPQYTISQNAPYLMVTLPESSVIPADGGSKTITIERVPSSGTYYWKVETSGGNLFNYSVNAEYYGSNWYYNTGTITVSAVNHQPELSKTIKITADDDEIEHSITIFKAAADFYTTTEWKTDYNSFFADSGSNGTTFTVSSKSEIKFESLKPSKLSVKLNNKNGANLNNVTKPAGTYTIYVYNSESADNYLKMTSNGEEIIVRVN